MMNRYLLISIATHLLILNLIWVGFSVQLPRNKSVFIYLGESIASAKDIYGDVLVDGAKDNSTAEAIVEPSAAFFSPWIKMREVNKPR